MFVLTIFSRELPASSSAPLILFHATIICSFMLFDETSPVSIVRPLEPDKNTRLPTTTERRKLLFFTSIVKRIRLFFHRLHPFLKTLLYFLIHSHSAECSPCKRFRLLVDKDFLTFPFSPQVL